MDSVFSKLNAVNVSDKVEKKNNLSYLSWAWAWGEVKKEYPRANYRVYETADGTIYWTDKRTAWVKVGVTIEELEHIEYLPVMDFNNKSITIDKVTSFDVNKTIQRALTKAIARHGLGLYIYAGEDMPEKSEDHGKGEEQKTEKPSAPAKLAAEGPLAYKGPIEAVASGKSKTSGKLYVLLTLGGEKCYKFCEDTEQQDADAKFFRDLMSEKCHIKAKLKQMGEVFSVEAAELA